MNDKSQKTNIKKILLLVPNNVAGGAERVLSSLANEFSRRGIESHFMTFDAKSSFYTLEESVRIVRLNAGTDGMSKLEKYLKLPFLEIKRWKRMRRYMKELRPDVVISFLFMTNIIGWLCCKELDIPIVLSERNDPTKYSRGKKKIMDYVYSRVEGFVCQSDVIKKLAEKDYGLNNIVVIPNPINENQVNKNNVVEKKKEIISVGRLVKQKNHSLLIRAFSMLSKEYAEYILTIYGEGPLRTELQTMINELNLTDRVFLPGVEKDAIKYHNDAALFVMSSDFEGYPNALVEAMANGITSISTDFNSGTAREIIQNGKNGYLVPVNDEIALKRCMEDALENMQRNREVGECGRAIYGQTKLENVANIWLRYIEEIVREREKE